MRKKGFTLIELLVVISIIALLLSILMPALTKVKEQAKAVVCSSNLRQMAVALEVYTAENENKSLSTAMGEDVWIFKLAPYFGQENFEKEANKKLDGVMKIISCPSTLPPEIIYDENDPTTFFSAGTKIYKWRFQGGTAANNYAGAGAEGSYGINEWYGGFDLSLVDENGWGYVDSSEVSSSSFRNKMIGRPDVPVFGDAIWYGAYPRRNDIVFGAYDGNPEGDNPYVSGVARFFIERHGDAINMSFADAHVEKVRLKDMWKLKWNMGYKVTESELPLGP